MENNRLIAIFAILMTLSAILGFVVICLNNMYADMLQDEIADLEIEVDEAEMDAYDKKLQIQALEDDLQWWMDNPIIEYETIWINETVIEEIYTHEYIYIDNAICDVNRDFTVDYHDVSEVLWYIKHGVTIVEDIIHNKYGNPYEKLYDVNRDGKVTMLDVDMIWEYSD